MAKLPARKALTTEMIFFYIELCLTQRLVCFPGGNISVESQPASMFYCYGHCTSKISILHSHAVLVFMEQSLKWLCSLGWSQLLTLQPIPPKASVQLKEWREQHSPASETKTRPMACAEHSVDSALHEDLTENRSCDQQGSVSNVSAAVCPPTFQRMMTAQM